MAETYAHIGALSIRRGVCDCGQTVLTLGVPLTGRTTSDERDRDMIRGKRLERDIRRAMATADVASLAELARRSRVQRDTLYAWFRGERPPKPDTLAKVADVLGVGIGDLWDYAPAVATAEVTLTDLAVELREWRSEAKGRTDVVLEQLGAIRRLLEAWRAGPPSEPDGAPALPSTNHPDR